MPQFICPHCSNIFWAENSTICPMCEKSLDEPPSTLPSPVSNNLGREVPKIPGFASFLAGGVGGLIIGVALGYIWGAAFEGFSNMRVTELSTFSALLGGIAGPIAGICGVVLTVFTGLRWKELNTFDYLLMLSAGIAGFVIGAILLALFGMILTRSIGAGDALWMFCSIIGSQMGMVILAIRTAQLKHKDLFPSPMLLFGGMVGGGFIGFLFRPSAPLVDQLEFQIDEASLKYLVVGAAIGAMIGLGVSFFTPFSGEASLARSQPFEKPQTVGLMNGSDKEKTEEEIAVNMKVLAKLRDDGVITEEEFKTKKEDILKRL